MVEDGGRPVEHHDVDLIGAKHRHEVRGQLGGVTIRRPCGLRGINIHRDIYITMQLRSPCGPGTEQVGLQDFGARPQRTRKVLLKVLVHGNQCAL